MAAPDEAGQPAAANEPADGEMFDENAIDALARETEDVTVPF